MTTRRSFLELGAKVAAAGCVLGRAARAVGPERGMIYGVQMYMVRKQAATDLAGALRAIKAAGFGQVELYPIAYKHPAAELKGMVADAGLASVAGHFDYAQREMSVEYAQGLGLKYVVCPVIARELWGSVDGFKQAGAYFNQWGEKVRAAGMEFAFHNHCYEFQPMGGSTGFAELMKASDPKLVKLELDMYWLAQAGQDPSGMLAKYKDRAVLVHLKDRVAGAPTGYTMGPPQQFADLGKGSIDWKALLEQAKRQGIRYAFLDQDETNGPVEQAMRESHAYLEGLHV